MPVQTRHREYDKALKHWTMCDDLYEGEARIKEKGPVYLPMLSGQEPDHYSAYKQRGNFFNAFGRTVQGLTGSVFRRDPACEVPKKLVDKIENITDSGQDLFTMSLEVVKEILTKGRFGLLIDKGKKGEGDKSAFISVIPAESIINWSSRFVGGREEINKVVLQDVIHEEDPEDEYGVVEVNQIRVFRLIGNECYAEIWMKREEDNDFILQEDPIPLEIQGKAIDFVPFIFGGSDENTSKISKPPFLDLAYVNLSHWRKSVDYSHGLHYTALPTPWAAGFSDKKTYTIGPHKVWVSPDNTAKAGYLEFTGRGLEAIKEALERDEHMMSVLGAKAIDKTRDKVETAETARIRQASETSNLIKLVRGSSWAIRDALKLLARWEGISEKGIEFQLNTDFVSLQISPQQITSLMQAMQGSAISKDTFIHQMIQGEILPPGRTIDEEKSLIEAEGMDPFSDDDLIMKNDESSDEGESKDKAN